MQEKWKVVSANGNYEISSLGRIRSLDRYVNCNGGERFCEGQLIKPVKDSNGYYHVDLKPKPRTTKVHKLVSEAFLLKIPGLTDVNHIDGDKANNCVCNLEFVTKSQNEQHAMATGLKRIGEDRVNAKLKESEVIFLIKQKGDFSTKEFAKILQVSESSIWHAVSEKGKTFRHLHKRLRANDPQ